MKVSTRWGRINTARIHVTCTVSYRHVVQSNDFGAINFHGTGGGDSAALGHEALGNEGLASLG